MSDDERGRLEAFFGDRLAGELTREHDAEEVALYVQAVEATPPEWWQKAYAGGPPVGPAKLIRPLYAIGNPSAKPPSSDGPDVVAVKRALWRGGRWKGPSSAFDDTFSKAFAIGKGPNVIDSGLAGFQRQMKLAPATGQLGDATYQTLRYARVPETLPHAGEPLFDATAVELLEQAAKPKPPNADAVRSAIADYCRRTIGEAPAWHYRQAREMQNLGGNPDKGGYSDCSEHATCAYYWAKHTLGAAVPDPNHRNFDGYGYTGTLIDNPRVSSPYKVGDLALYGPSTGDTQHVCTCYVGGEAGYAKWCSHGSEDAPYTVGLHYRGDLLCVVRPSLQ